MRAAFMNNELWRRKASYDFGDLFYVYHILTSVAALDLAPDLAQKFARQPSDWYQYYIKKSSSISETDKIMLLEQAETECSKAQVQLRSLCNGPNTLVLNQLASKMMWVLELRRDIQKILDGHKETQNEVPLLQDDYISPALATVLSEIFQCFDKDGDGALCTEELDQFVYATNGTHPPVAFLTQMTERFGCNSKGAMAKEGFLSKQSKTHQKPEKIYQRTATIRTR
ncbi:hypothetical protein EC973_006748 [Apophysomyces ossiformis]|uniref:EF-hand domain-containing protein n=1 Tax=Apophysomyces ossiformis TaxID=679940 RepID=A0A8H7EQU1_9FUNG|nr:hypothetical protein EC973_006748 [Apophysomyces ossiformis]